MPSMKNSTKCWLSIHVILARCSKILGLTPHTNPKLDFSFNFQLWIFQVSSTKIGQGIEAIGVVLIVLWVLPQVVSRMASMTFDLLEV